MAKAPFNKSGTGRRRFLRTTLGIAAGVIVGGCGTGGRSLTFACAAGWRTIVDPAIRSFERSSGIYVRTLYDGSGRLAAMIELGTPVDIFLAADASYIVSIDSVKTSLVSPLREQRVRCVRSPAAAVVTFDELLQRDFRISIASPRTAAVGKVLRDAIGKTKFATLSTKTITRTTVTEVAADVAKLGAADYGFVWNTTWPDDTTLITLPMEELTGAVGNVAMGQYVESDAVKDLAVVVSEAVQESAPAA